MQRKVLFCATVDYHFKAFHLPYFQWFKELGWEVHTASNGHLKLPYVDQSFRLPIQRSPFHLQNSKAYVQMKQLLRSHHYDLIHCHTPMGSVITRLAARKTRKKGTQVIYTAHGFHFCSGAPIKNWLLYYPVEKMLAASTDCLITINEEDYKRALKLSNGRASVHHLHGVGVDTKRFAPVNGDQKQMLRLKHGFNEQEFIVLYTGELNQNKNQSMLIKACAFLKPHIPHLKVVFAGEGTSRTSYEQLVQTLGIEQNIQFAGFCKDIEEWVNLCDVCVSTSLREGLGMNLLEGMSAEKPVVATNNRGHQELVKDGVNGFLVEPHDVDALAHYLHQLYLDRNCLGLMGKAGRSIALQFAKERTVEEMADIYTNHMKKTEKVINHA
ncbi:glycosyltransferase family 4 protein [Bacillus sp. NPDC077027]|uniref:glycosyltransferase family 4 protein n=1 Tax=Bacillus sp. NPDC077027 TaxID=3390548 RepID=UPI003D01D525